MRLPVLILFFFILAFNTFSQSMSQPQGEYHKTLVHKTDLERRKLKHKDYVGGGMIMFAKKDIPREGKTKEVEPMLETEFKANEKFVGRIYLPRAVDLMDNKTPEAIAFRIYVDNASPPLIKQISNKKLPDATWSSWLIDFPEDFKNELDAIGPGKHQIRIELWSINAYEDADVYAKRLVREEREAEEAKKKEKEAEEAAANGGSPDAKKVAAKPHPTARPQKEKIDKNNKDNFWAMGEFTLSK
jgi:hypothetical protein